MARRPSASMIVALVALVAALGGTAAATRYLVSSPKQLRPGVITERLLSKAVRVKLARVGNTGNTGPTGATGPKGIQGEKGDQGPIGPSAGYGAAGAPGDLVTGTNDVVALAVPAGAYVIHGNADVVNHGLDTGVTCALNAPDGTPLDSAVLTVAGGGTASFPFDAAVTLAAGAVKIVCTEGGGENLHVNRARLTAVKVGSLNP